LAVSLPVKRLAVGALVGMPAATGCSSGGAVTSRAAEDFWTVGQWVDGQGDTVTVEVPAQPARCDAHSFGSATGGTTFFVNITIGSGDSAREAQVRLPMSPEVTAETFAYAADACGWEEE
jgi:hypothetical protein